MIKELFQTKCPIPVWKVLVCAVTLLFGCNQRSYNSPEGYDLNNPSKMELGKVLNEISGLSFNTDNNTLLAVSESKEKVFEINIEKRKLKDFTDRVVNVHSELKDLVKVDSFVYLLGSKGIIYIVPPHKHADTSGVVGYPLSNEQKNDFESIYYDPARNGLVVLCKSCAFETEHFHSAFRFDLSNRKFDSTAIFTIDETEIQNLLKDDKVHFKPSAAALHPVNKRLYILSSSSNLLVVSNPHGQVIEAYHMNPDNFAQAEGIAFAPNGDMYIANAGRYGERSTLQLFTFNPGKNK